MKAVMVLFDSSLREEVFMILKLANIANYTLFHNLHGSGNQGKKEGTIAWPGTNEILLALVDQDSYKNLKDSVAHYKKDKGQSQILLFQWMLDEVVI